MENFARIFNGFYLLTVAAKLSILGVYGVLASYLLLVLTLVLKIV